MYRLISKILILLVATLFATVEAAPGAYDIRILIDVTGSMAQNDPDNSRSSAIRLVSELMPNNASAGIWTFGRYVNNNVIWAKVDDSWRQAAVRAAAEINSSGRYSDMEKGLARASAGWKTADDNSRRIILLLSDGGVDISNNAAKNEKSRQQILGKTLSSLKAAGASVHAIALSDEADVVLLRRLALETGGSFLLAAAQTDLTRLFAGVIERISAPEQVPLQDNQFLVDEGISNLTLLLFRGANARPGRLVSPGNIIISAQQPGSASWRSEVGYDLIKIHNPGTGTWRIDAEADAQNRVIVESDLKLNLLGVPSHIRPMDGLEIAAGLQQHSEIIQKFSYLRFVEFNLTHTSVDGIATTYPMKASSELKQKGQYLFRGEGRLEEGWHSFVVSARGPAFERSRRFDIEVRWPVEVSVEPGTLAGSYEVSVKAREEYLQAQSLIARLEIEAPDGSRRDLDMLAWSGRLSAHVQTTQKGTYQAHIRLSALSNAAQQLELDLGAWPMQGPGPVVAEAGSIGADN